MATSEAGIDLLLTDVIMPEQSGLELVKQIERGHRKTRFVFMSGYSGDMIKRYGCQYNQIHSWKSPSQNGRCS